MFSTTLVQVAGAQRGDQAAWRALDARVRPWLLDVLGKRDFPPDVGADDLVQEVLIEVCATFDRFLLQEGSSFRAWVRSIAELRLRDVLRRSKAKKRGGKVPSQSIEQGGQDGRGLDIPHGDISQTRVARSHEFAAALAGVLHGFNDKQRMVLELRLFEELEFEAIAARMRMNTTENARTFYWRTKELLKERLARFAP
ncbi:MAG: sigma-70 family RNA polymerase sigma factor [Planctomycetota bacterium]